VTAARAALRTLWGPGPAAGVRIRRILPPGTRLTVGRDDDCDLALPLDSELSSHHFSIEWDGVRGRGRDERSRRGTQVGGAPMIVRGGDGDGDGDGQTALRHGTWIRAGATDFVFEIEMPAPIVRAERRAAREALEPAAVAGTLWGIVDASRSDRVLSLLRSAMDVGRSLYEGTQGDALAEVAPYLVRFEPGSRLLDALIDEGLSSGFAIYLESEEDERALRRHFRRFLVVEAEGVGPRTYFRFYDPAVFAAFWDMATLHQRAELSRNIDAFWVPSGEHDLHRMEPLAPIVPPESASSDE